MTNKHRKTCLTSLAVTEIKIKITRFHCTPIRRTNRNNSYNKSWVACREFRYLIHWFRECKMIIAILEILSHNFTILDISSHTCTPEHIF